MSSKLLFEEAFETYIDEKLRDLGYKTIRNVYVEYNGKKSQIDIIAFTGKNIWCIECKSYNMDKLYFKRSSSQWRYKDLKGNIHYIHSPKRQNQNHIKVLMGVLYNGVDGELYEKFNQGVPPVLNAIVFKANDDLEGLSKYTRLDNGIYTENNLHLLQYDNPMGDLSEMSKVIYNYLKQFNDDSPEKLREHIKYIEDCKLNKKGFFSDKEDF